jgi:hypothetical protein
MKFLSPFLAVMLLLPMVCFAQTSSGNPGEPANKVNLKQMPVDCKRNQSWSQTEERCVTTVTCEKAKKPWTLRCLVDGEYKTATLQDLYKQKLYLKEISAKGAYYFRDFR